MGVTHLIAPVITLRGSGAFCSMSTTVLLTVEESIDALRRTQRVAYCPLAAEATRRRALARPLERQPRGPSCSQMRHSSMGGVASLEGASPTLPTGEILRRLRSSACLPADRCCPWDTIRD
jgi:hypothetical protein